MKKNIGTVALLSLLAACGNSADENVQAAGSLSGTVAIDGSSTVFPITEAVAEEFRKVMPNIRVTVGISGTGGGFKKFMAGETDISDASRYIKQKEVDGCEAAGLSYIELPVAYDGLAVVVNKENSFASSMTVAELRSIWAADATAKTWKDVRPEWPDREFNLYAPGQDSGTFDYFTEVVNGKSGNCRPDATFSEDDNVLVRGVSGDPDGLAFFGFAYYIENAGQLNVVAVDGGEGPIIPSMETVKNGTYAPLSRPLFIYASVPAAERPEVDAFLTFYLERVGELSAEVGYVPFPQPLYTSLKNRYKQRVTGTLHEQSGSVEALYN
ncbi:MAG: phosphate transport system substrate-binding protein [Candidatus Paceibacteria bacterium]|jgi:phosphate transport system substrate-binding protein